MKSTGKIIALFIVVAGIVVFWLVPGINKAGNERYTRIYEDTDKPERSRNNPQPLSFKDTTKSTAGKKVHERKKYKRESIEAGAKFSDIKPSMFSRAIQFEKELEMPVVPEKAVNDSSNLLLKISVDTTKHTPVAKTI